MNQYACDPDENSVVIETPFRFGQIVYHKVATEKVAGIVIGFVVVMGSPAKCLVKWGDDRGQDEHFAIELSAEYNPFHFK